MLSSSVGFSKIEDGAFAMPCPMKFSNTALPQTLPLQVVAMVGIARTLAQKTHGRLRLSPQPPPTCLEDPHLTYLERLGHDAGVNVTGASMIQSNRPHSLQRWLMSSSLLLSSVLSSIMATCNPASFKPHKSVWGAERPRAASHLEWS